MGELTEARQNRLSVKRANPVDHGKQCCKNPNCVATRRLVDAILKRPEAKDENVASLTVALDDLAKSFEEKYLAIRAIEQKLVALQPYALKVQFE